MRSFDDVATYFDVTICPAPGTELPDGPCIVAPGDHTRGATIGSTRIVHWTPRRMTRPGLRRFLMVVARARLKGWLGMNRSMRLYAENVWAQRAALELHVRIPRRLSGDDRRYVRWRAHHGEPMTPAARRWAHRIE